MSTGHKYIRDDGEEYKSVQNAALSLIARPESTFEFSELDMSGVRKRPATEEIQKVAKKIQAGIV